MATGYVLERLSELREEAYCKVLRCFLASQQYDLVWPLPLIAGPLLNLPSCADLWRPEFVHSMQCYWEAADLPALKQHLPLTWLLVPPCLRMELCSSNEGLQSEVCWRRTRS